MKIEDPTEEPWIAVVDYGVGNLRNVYKALEAVGAPARIVTSPAGLRGAAGIVLPGVGAFGDAAANLRSAGFEAPLHVAMDAGTPLLGICVGMQLLFDESEEMGQHTGLGVIPGRVLRFAADMRGPDGGPAGRALKVPQIGWNQLHHRGTDPLLADVPDGAYAYFVHSYFCAPLDATSILATTDFGTDYASVVRRDNVWGIQCHPEKSQAVGLQILRNFVAIAMGETEEGSRRGKVTIIIYPAIDLRGGQVVRLRQGDPAAQTTYGDDPAAAARRWAEQGAEWLHVVNLDGAFAGEATARPSKSDKTSKTFALPLNLQRLAEIRAAMTLPIQFGGGMRTLADVALGLELGATRIVLGTVAVREPEIVGEAVRRFGSDRIVVGIDARDGLVATHGWQETSALDTLTVALRMHDLGVQRIVYTDIARDGTLSGVNVSATAALARGSGLKVIASGGVASLADIRALAGFKADGIEGVIVGQALYTGAIDLREAIAAGR